MLLSEEQLLIQESARKFAQERLAPNSAEWERKAAFPRGLFQELGAMGFMGMTVPAEWGGAGADYVAYALALQEIAAGDGALATVVSGHNSVGVMPILNYGTDLQKQRYVRDMASGRKLTAFCLTEPQGGSDAAAIRTRATRKGDSYVLSGTKQYITSGSTADIALVFAVTDPTGGKRGISAFIVDTKTPGYIVSRIEKKMGQNASDTCEIRLENAVVPADDRLGEEGQGYRIALANLEGGRIGIASQSVGLAQAALEIAVAYAHERQSFGKPIFEHQAVLVPPCRHGHQTSGGPSTHASRSRPEERWPAVPRRSFHGQARMPLRPRSRSARMPSKPWAVPATCRISRSSASIAGCAARRFTKVPTTSSVS